jgi:hypothetical protein
MVSQHIFIKEYPVNPRNFAEKLRRARMDERLPIMSPARMLGVIVDTLISWKLTGISSTSSNLEKVEVVLGKLGSHEIGNKQD